MSSFSSRGETGEQAASIWRAASQPGDADFCRAMLTFAGHLSCSEQLVLVLLLSREKSLPLFAFD